MLYFESSDKETTAVDKEMMRQQTEQAALNYSKMLFADWVAEAYEFCIDKCMRDDKMLDGGAKLIEKKCTKNWFRKLSNGLLMFNRIHELNESGQAEEHSISKNDFFNNPELSGSKKYESPLIKQYLSKHS